MREIASGLDDTYLPDRRQGRADNHLDNSGMRGVPRPGDGPNYTAPAAEFPKTGHGGQPVL